MAKSLTPKIGDLGSKIKIPTIKIPGGKPGYKGFEQIKPPPPPPKKTK